MDSPANQHSAARFGLTSEAIVGPLLTSMPASAGACVAFEGAVRHENDAKQVSALEYEAFDELAVPEGSKIIAEAVEKFGLTACVCVHRTGLLQIGEIAVRVEAYAPHRRAAFEGCQYVIDEIKMRVPIWKKEHYNDGPSEWLAPQPPQPLLESDFYKRQLTLPQIGVEGQQKLKAARVLVVGAGGLGCPALLYLAAAGVGTIGIADDDVVSADCLHRQVLFNVSDIGKPKAAVAAERLQARNPFTNVAAHPFRVDESNVRELVNDYDVVLDCTDNFPSKFLLNDICVSTGKLLVQASIYQFEGQILVVDTASDGGCLRCLWPDPSQTRCIKNCSEAGVLGATAGVLGSMQAAECLKLILGIGDDLRRDLLVIDLLSGESNRIRRTPDPTCPCCGDGIMPENSLEISSSDLQRERFVLVDIREAYELEQEPISSDLHIPMGELNPGDERLKGGKPIALICAHGVRSYYATVELRQAGINCFSVAGGVEALNRSER